MNADISREAVSDSYTYTMVTDHYLIVGMHFDLISRRQKCIEANDQFRMSFEKCGHALDDSRSVNGLRFKFFHYIQEVIIDLRLIIEFEFDLIQIGQGVLYLSIQIDMKHLLSKDVTNL